ncbi:MAG: Hpt domain-containing protein [Desulfovibrionaceae bacterium]|nr:Hpt domain-containing protein [Desulfovibrionaceae bacterium]
MASATDDSMMDDEILAMFIEDTKEHLGGIEANLMDMERQASDLDPELVNKVFRAAHSIKGGAGFLNLNNIRDLSHKLENVLHMIRNKEIVPDNWIISKLLGGFDKLLTLVENALESDEQDISEHLAGLSGLTEELLPDEQKGSQHKTVDIALPDGRPVFAVDALSLIQALKGGNFLYLVEYDLIHDVHAQRKTPLDVIKAMESSGLIVDSKVDVTAVGDLDALPTNKIPFYVLYSTIVEPDIISYLFAISPDRIHRLELDPASLAADMPAGQAPDAASLSPGEPGESVTPVTPGADGPWNETVGAVALTGQGGLVTIGAGASVTVDTVLDLRQALLLALSRCRETVVDLKGAVNIDLAGMQLLCSACKTFAAEGKKMSLSEAGGDLGGQAERAGFSRVAAAGCDAPVCPLHAG